MRQQPGHKNSVGELAIFGAASLFRAPKSTSNLVRPDFGVFLDYSRVFFDRHQYTNNGALVKLLEQRLAGFHQTEFCVAFCSGFWGLVLAMSALATGGKREVIMPSLTYRRMADIASWAKLTPHFCEVDETTLAQSPATVRSCINPDTALIVAVHPFVNCCDVEGLVALAREHGIPLLFDSVESPYESVPGGKVGGFGDAECFSLHASKLLNGFEGGYLTTNDAALARRLALVRGFGFEGEDNVKVPGGLNAKMNEVHAAMALACLDDLEQQVARNRRRYLAYKALLAGIPGMRLVEFDETGPTSFKNILVEFLGGWPLTRDETIAVLNAEKVYARAYYSPPLHRKWKASPSVAADLSLTDRLAERYALLPCGEQVSEDDIRGIAGLLGFIQANGGRIKARLRESGGGQA